MPKRILVVDDDDGLRLLIRRVLERDHYEVVEARDGEEGLRAYRSAQPDLVLLDLFMPVKDGVEMLRDLRAEFANPKVVTMSGGGSRNDVTILQTARLLGSQASLVKPFGAPELLKVVREMVGDALSGDAG